MIKLKKILKEIISEHSYEGDVDYEIFEIRDDIIRDIFSDFLYHNNNTMTKHVPWQLISFPRLKKIWEDFVKVGHVRDERGFQDIENIMETNTIKLWVFTELSGHTSNNQDEYFDEAFDSYLNDYINYRNINFNPNQYQLNFDRKTGKAKRQTLSKPSGNKINNKYLDDFIKKNELENYDKDELKFILKEELLEKFSYYYSVDEKTGAEYISDYGLKPLLKALSELRSLDTMEEKLPIIDQMLNVVHQRSDLAGWFVMGGSASLSKLSGI